MTRRRGPPLVHRAGFGRRLGLAGHRLDRGLRAAPERPAGLRRLGGRPDALDIAGDPLGVPVIRHRRRRARRRTAASRAPWRPTSAVPATASSRDPPTCLFVHQGTFMATFLDEAVARLGGRYAVMPFPDIDPRFAGALIGAGDLIALLRDTPGGRALISYLLSRRRRPSSSRDGGALSGNILLKDYPNDILTAAGEAARRRAHLPLRRLRRDARGHGPGVLAGGPRLHGRPVPARRDPRRSSTPSRPWPTGQG